MRIFRFGLSEPIWVGDLGTGKINLFYQLTPDFDGFWFFAGGWILKMF
jgi:hypothetical protein